MKNDIAIRLYLLKEQRAKVQLDVVAVEVARLRGTSLSEAQVVVSTALEHAHTVCSRGYLSTRLGEFTIMPSLQAVAKGISDWIDGIDSHVVK